MQTQPNILASETSGAVLTGTDPENETEIEKWVVSFMGSGYSSHVTSLSQWGEPQRLYHDARYPF